MVVRERLIGVVAAAWVLLTGPVSAALIVDSPQVITRQVTVQLIQTALDSGASPATAFGNATQRADIEAGIDRIWAQAGIDVNILPTITRYNNTFAYQGTSGSGLRPEGDFNTIFNNASTARILNSDLLTLNLILVNAVPGFMTSQLSDNTSAGYARVAGNGIIGYVGDALLPVDDWRDVVSSVMAHEIGHNLGLNHTAAGITNLMSPNGKSQQLTSTQISAARSSNFARLYTAPATLIGDYNNNGVVDAADYVVWRKTLNTAGGYTAWRSHFGQTGGSGSLVSNSVSRVSTSAVPEPQALLLFLMALPFLLTASGRMRVTR